MTEQLLPTLFLFHAFVFALLAGLMYLIWQEDQDAEEYRWWFSALLVICCGLLLFTFREPAGFLSIAGANALNLLGIGLVWGGVRVFAGKPAPKSAVIAGAVVWLVVFLFGDFSVRILGRAFLVAIYSFLITYELSSRQKERTLALRAARGLAAAHGCFNALVAVVAPLMAGESSGFFASPLVAGMALEALGFGIVFGFALLALSKERMVTRHKIAAETDPLTGLSNRRRFDRFASAALRSRPGPGERALLIFDLDCLKQINDRYGHSMGDRALTTFGEVAAENLRSGDLLARIGGDEFAALLNQADGAAAVAVAERIRLAYAAAAASLEDGFGSVSIGIAIASRETTALAEIKEAADAALYAAKAGGRNRVSLSASCARPAPIERAGEANDGQQPDVPPPLFSEACSEPRIY